MAQYILKICHYDFVSAKLVHQNCVFLKTMGAMKLILASK